MEYQTILMTSGTLLGAWVITVLMRLNRAVENVSDVLVSLVSELKRVELIDVPDDQLYDEAEEPDLLNEDNRTS